MVMANMLANLYRHHPRGGPGLHWSEVEPICEALDGPMSDDASEEIEALEWLNRECYDGTHFEMVDGELMLLGPQCKVCGDRIDADGNCQTCALDG